MNPSIPGPDPSLPGPKASDPGPGPDREPKGRRFGWNRPRDASDLPTRAGRRRFRWVGRLAAILVLVVPVLLLGRLLFFEGPFLPVTPLPEVPLVDLHCHAAGIGAGDSGCYVSPRMRSNFRFRIYLEAFGVTESQLREHGDMALLEKLSRDIASSRRVGSAVVLALDGVVDDQGNLDRERTDVYVPNAFVAEGARRFGNLLFGASIHPRRPDALARLDEAVAQGAVLVKWIPSVMDIDPADPRYIPFYRRLAEYRLPLLSHTGPEKSFTSAADALADPHRLRLALDHGVRVIAAHTSPGRSADEGSNLATLRRMMTEYPQLYADISALSLVNRIADLRATLAAPECRGRLVYGSDYPLINTALVSPWYYPLNLTEARRREIASIPNPWDRDVELKQALGVPPEVFTAGRALLVR